MVKILVNIEKCLENEKKRNPQKENPQQFSDPINLPKNSSIPPTKTLHDPKIYQHEKARKSNAQNMKYKNMN